MIVIHARNVHQALVEALYQLRVQGIERPSRNGPVRMFPTPVTTVYDRPAERVMFWPERDANPFFHLIESLWMLAGRNDVELPAYYVQRMRSFSDDGVTFHGAYGYRWRKHFDFDQLAPIIEALRDNPDDRRQVLSMWDARSDLGRRGKDLPCNLQAVFQINHKGALDMMVTNRSNDMVWGAYGANGVHFSVLHEFVARAVGVEQGTYRQVSANFHAYLDTLKQVEMLADQPADYPSLGQSPNDPYHHGEVEPFPLMATPYLEWLAELDVFLDSPNLLGFKDPFFKKVAGPIVRAHAAYKEASGDDRFLSALAILEDCRATDWRRACQEWIHRRWDNAKAKESKARAKDDGVAYE